MVDRVWPRGVSKQKLKMDVWLKDIAPSHELRRWLTQNSQNWDEFKNKYREELKDKTEFLNQILDLEKENEIVTLVYTSGNTEQNSAIVLKEILDELKS
ncbi:uroporphyrin-III methyltransferase [Methanobacterium ferruginis]|nr:uroporphyrin-III methyltransferase [Methanobacterium ferruginis]